MSEIPTVADLHEVIMGLIWQFGYRTVVKGKPAISSGCLSDMERAFQIVGWDDPHFLTEEEQDGAVCEIKGCNNPATCGMSWPGDITGKNLGPYLRICSNHAAMERQGEPCPPIKQRALDREATRDPVTRRLPA